MRFNRVQILVFILLVGWPFGSNAEERIHLRACFENWAPYYMRMKDGTLKGPVFKVVERVAKTINADVEFIELPYKRCLSEVRNSRFDMVLLSSPGMAGMVQSKTSLAFWNLVAVLKKDSPLKSYSNMKQFKGKRVGSFVGYSYPGVITAGSMHWSSEINITYSEKTEDSKLTILRLIEQDRIDLAFLDLAWVNLMTSTYDLDVKILRPPVYSDPSMIGYAPNSKTVREQFETELEKLADTGELDRIYNTHLGMPLSAF